MLASVAAQAGLCLAWSESPEDNVLLHRGSNVFTWETKKVTNTNHHAKLRRFILIQNQNSLLVKCQNAND